MIIKHTRVSTQVVEAGSGGESIGGIIDNLLQYAGEDIITSVTVEITDADRAAAANARLGASNKSKPVR